MVATLSLKKTYWRTPESPSRLKYHELSNESEITILNSYELKDDAEERTILESQTNGFSVNERVERV